MRHHLEVDLVRRTSEEETPQPESYKFENRWLTSMTALINHPRIANRRAVVIITLDNEQLSEQLKTLDSAAGRFALGRWALGDGAQFELDLIRGGQRLLIFEGRPAGGKRPVRSVGMSGSVIVSRVKAPTPNSR